MEHQLTVDLEKKEDISIFRLSGQLDFLSTPQLENKLRQVLDQNENNVIIDFSKISYLSSAGIRVLLETTKILRDRSGKLVIFGLQPFPLETIMDANFNFILDLANTEEEALAQFK